MNSNVNPDIHYEFRCIGRRNKIVIGFVLDLDGSVHHDRLFFFVKEGLRLLIWMALVVRSNWLDIPTTAGGL